MNNFINILVNDNIGLSKEFLWKNIMYIIPLLLIIFFFSFGFNFIKEYLLSRKVKKFMSAGGFHSSDENLKRYASEVKYKEV